MIEELSKDHSVRDLCELLEVTRSGYYAWSRGQESAREMANRVMAQEIQRVFKAKRSRYGSPRITEELRQQGQRCNHKRVERLMRQEGLKARSSKRRKVRTTNSDHDQPVAPNLLLGRPAPVKANEVWVADITYVPTAEGWLFVAAVMDLYSRQILGWSVWESLVARGALQALARAMVKRGYPRGVIHHSDRGIQYACAEYRRELQRNGLVASMSRKGNCYDNAAMEAFWSTLKREALAESAAWSKDRVRRELFEFIESDYNRSRLHSSLGYQSPVDFEDQNH
ncbi:MAG TPA: IS3 family transposase [Alphaproteobacteria bacterium]|nr:IS3 family transposase [Alphaproteobacteria bacterium]